MTFYNFHFLTYPQFYSIPYYQFIVKFFFNFNKTNNYKKNFLAELEALRNEESRWWIIGNLFLINFLKKKGLF